MHTSCPQTGTTHVSASGRVGLAAGSSVGSGRPIAQSLCHDCSSLHFPETAVTVSSRQEVDVCGHEPGQTFVTALANRGQGK